MPQPRRPYHRWVIWSAPCGNYTLYSIQDGWFVADPAVMFPGSDLSVWNEHTDETGQIRINIGCFLVTGGNRATLIDTGMGSRAVPGGRSGQLSQALALIGTRPEDVANVIHTHMHADHVGGNMLQPGEPMFPNATHHVQASELDHWAAASGEVAERARAMIDPLIESGRVSALDGDKELLDGIRVVASPGHTPGHQSVIVSSGLVNAVIGGDVLHHPVQATNPRWGVAADLDPEAARKTREKLVEQIAGSGSLLAGGHFPEPGIGYLETLGGVVVFVSAPTVQVA